MIESGLSCKCVGGDAYLVLRYSAVPIISDIHPIASSKIGEEAGRRKWIGYHV